VDKSGALWSEVVPRTIDLPMESPQNDQPLFTGEFRHAMDAKNRVTIPSRWRRGDIEEFFAIPNPDGGFLMVMPPSEFKRLAEKVEKDESLQPAERRKFIRQFSSRAQHVTGDKQSDVVLVGAYLRFEIWSPARWQEKVNEETPTFRYMLDRVGI
jgi:MraZ protein